MNAEQLNSHYPAYAAHAKAVHTVARYAGLSLREVLETMNVKPRRRRRIGDTERWRMPSRHSRAFGQWRGMQTLMWRKRGQAC